MLAPYETVVQRIQQLANEQQRIYLSPDKYGLSHRQRRRLELIKDELQLLWLERKRGRVRFNDALDKFGEDRKFTKFDL